MMLAKQTTLLMLKINYKMIKKIETILILIAIFILSLLILSGAIKSQEKMECEKWQRDSIKYSRLWFSTEWQKAQCLNYGIELK